MRPEGRDLRRPILHEGAFALWSSDAFAATLENDRGRSVRPPIPVLRESDHAENAYLASPFPSGDPGTPGPNFPWRSPHRPAPFWAGPVRGDVMKGWNSWVGGLVLLVGTLACSEAAASSSLIPLEGYEKELRTLLEQGMAIPWEWVTEVDQKADEGLIFPKLRHIRPNEWSLEDPPGQRILLTILREPPPELLRYPPGTLLRPWWEARDGVVAGSVREVTAGAVIRVFPGEEGQHYRLIYLTQEVPDAPAPTGADQGTTRDALEETVDPIWLPAQASRPITSTGRLSRTETTEAAWTDILAEAEQRRQAVPSRFQSQLGPIPHPWSNEHTAGTWMNIPEAPGEEVYAGSSHLADSGSEWELTWGQWVIVEGAGIVLEHLQSWGMTAAPGPVWASSLGEHGPFVISFGWQGSAIRDVDGIWRWEAIWQD